MTPTALFLLITIVLLYIGYFFILPILSRSNYESGDSEDVLSTALYKNKLAELNTDLAAGTIDESEFKNAETELKLQLLSEATVNPDKVFTPPEALRYRMVLLLVLAIPSLVAVLYMWLGHPGAMQIEQPVATTKKTNLDPHAGMNIKAMQRSKITRKAATPNRANATPSSTASPHTTSNAISGLEAKLRANPNDINTLFTLASAYRQKREYAKSAALYKRIIARYPKNLHRGPNFAQIMSTYADVLASSQKGRLAGEPYKIILKALAADPNHYMALHLAGAYYFQKADYKTAIKFWTKLRNLVSNPEYFKKRRMPAAPNYAKGVSAQIASAQKLLGQKPTGMAPVVRASPAPDTSAKPEASPSAKSSATFAITGTVSIDPALKYTPAAGTHLFVFAKQPNGPPRPLAALKLSGISYPYKFTLTDKNMIMGGGKSLKDLLPLALTARITRSANSLDRTGAVYGVVTVTATNTDGVKITINKRH